MGHCNFHKYHLEIIRRTEIKSLLHTSCIFYFELDLFSCSTEINEKIAFIGIVHLDLNFNDKNHLFGMFQFLLEMITRPVKKLCVQKTAFYHNKLHFAGSVTRG